MIKNCNNMITYGKDKQTELLKAYLARELDWYKLEVILTLTPKLEITLTFLRWIKNF